MAKANYCPNCGAQLFNDVQACEYCGHDLRPKRSTSEQINDGFRDLGDTMNKTVNDLQDNKEFNVVLFVILLIFAWPVAIIYLILMQNKK